VGTTLSKILMRFEKSDDMTLNESQKKKTKILYFTILCHISLKISFNLLIKNVDKYPTSQVFYLLNTIVSGV